MTISQQLLITFSAGQSVSSSFQVSPAMRIAAIGVPAGWTAADIGFNVGNTVDANGNLTGGSPLYNSAGAVYSVKAAAGKVTLCPPQDLTTFPVYQLTSLAVGTANAQNQASAVTLTVYMDDAF